LLTIAIYKEQFCIFAPKKNSFLVLMDTAITLDDMIINHQSVIWELNQTKKRTRGYGRKRPPFKGSYMGTNRTKKRTRMGNMIKSAVERNSRERGMK
ncbi:MAG: hypothetical protein LBE13_03675, partial [Bacteroidales bacterium]|jgi:hypothetical protein|nr:hypothetical protein [Bacteroidales bacterium]